MAGTFTLIIEGVLLVCLIIVLMYVQRKYYAHILDNCGMFWDNWQLLLDSDVQSEEIPEELPPVALLPGGV